MQHGRNDPRRAVGRCRDHAPAGGVFFVDRQGEQVDPFHGAQGRADHVGFVQFLQAAMQLGRAAAHVQPAGQDAFVFQALFDAVLHGAPERQQPGTNLRLAAPDFFVGHHQFGDPQIVPFAQLEQLDCAIEIVRQHGVIRIQYATGRLGRIDDKTATDRIVGVAVQFTRFTFGNQGHGVGMVGQVFFEQQHVALPDEGHRQRSIQVQGVGFAQGRNMQSNRGRVDRVGPLPHQSHDHRVVAAVADAGGGQ
ncbi:hypothetical protein D3C76_914220 [compost metagenome]